MVAAVSPDDGVIEALESAEPTQFVVAVQWHPERSYESSAASRALFAAFLEAARSWSLLTRSPRRAGRVRIEWKRVGQIKTRRSRLRRVLFDTLPTPAYQQFQTYLELLVRWNQRISLTAVREPEQIITRHFVECAFTAQHLPPDIRTLLDYGSGAGFPGIPIAICRPGTIGDTS